MNESLPIQTLYPVKSFQNKGKPIYTPKKSENIHTLRDVYPNVHGITIHNSQKSGNAH